MPKKSYALRNRRGSMDLTFDEGLRIVLQWMELRRRNFEQLLQVWQKELYMLRRIWIGRTGNMGFGLISELPGFYNGVLPPSSSLTQVVNYERRRLAIRELSANELQFHWLLAPKYAPGY